MFVLFMSTPSGPLGQGGVVFCISFIISVLHLFLIICFAEAVLLGTLQGKPDICTVDQRNETIKMKFKSLKRNVV